MSNIITHDRTGRDRVFINVSTSGCGSGCRYCYVGTNCQAQQLVSQSELCRSIECCILSNCFTMGCNGTLVTLCPATEPFKNVYSSKLILTILEIIMPIGNQIQVSTKEKMPDCITDYIVNNSKYKGQVGIFVSMNTVSKSKIIEPGAEDVGTRLNNFYSMRVKDKNKLVHGCLYIKPFNMMSYFDRYCFVDIVKRYPIDSVCVGIEYKCIERTNKMLSHPAKTDLYSYGITACMESFAELLKESYNQKIFTSSTCVMQYALGNNQCKLTNKKGTELCFRCCE